jgi:hypothetical protein
MRDQIPPPESFSNTQTEVTATLPAVPSVAVDNANTSLPDERSIQAADATDHTSPTTAPPVAISLAPLTLPTVPPPRMAQSRPRVASNRRSAPIWLDALIAACLATLVFLLARRLGSSSSLLAVPL